MTIVSLRSAWKAARCMTSSESHQASRNFSRSSCAREANPESQPSSSPAKPSLTSALGLAPIAPRITSGTPISVAAGSPFSPGTKVSQIASRLARPPSLSVIVTNASNYQAHSPPTRGKSSGAPRERPGTRRRRVTTRRSALAPHSQRPGQPVYGHFREVHRSGAGGASAVSARERRESVPISPLPVTLDQVANSVHVVGELAGLELRPPLALALGTLPRGSSHLVDSVLRDDDGTIGVEDDRITRGEGRSSHLHRDVDLPRLGSVGAPHPDPARPDREAQLAKLLRVPDGPVDQNRRGLAALRLGCEQLAEQGDGPRLRHGQDEDVAGFHPVHRRMHHEDVVMSAADRPGRAGGARAGDHLMKVEIDQALAAGRLEDCRRAELAQLVVDAHNSLATLGTTRMKASAWRISAFPETRRAWLPRCSARCA